MSIENPVQTELLCVIEIISVLRIRFDANIRKKNISADTKEMSQSRNTDQVSPYLVL